MTNIVEVDDTLSLVGQQLRELRIARADTQAIFAQRLGVSTSTVRAIERGDATVAVGHWVAAWWALNRIDTLRDALKDSASLFDQAAVAGRKRAPRRTRFNP